MIKRKGVFYLIMTEDEELAKALRQVLEAYKSRWWKLITKYFDGKSEEPYYTTSESSSAK